MGTHKSTSRAKLYILVGYPGAGKTTTSQIIHNLTGAAHIWADYERRAMFGEPTHSHSESRKLYDHLNSSTEILLSESQSVVFDTNFNFRKDRDLLRALATQYNAETILIWIKIDKDIARKRALSDKHASDNSYLDTMTASDFKRITSHLEPPTVDETPIILDGTLLDDDYVAQGLGLPRRRLHKASQIIRHKLSGRRHRGKSKT